MLHTRACLSVLGQASHLGRPGCNLISHGGEGKGREGGEGVLKFEMGGGGLHFLRRKRGGILMRHGGQKNMVRLVGGFGKAQQSDFFCFCPW